MLAGLVLSASIPEAFGKHGLAFAGAYAAMQIGRTLFFLWAVRDASVVMRRNFQRILVWFTVSGDVLDRRRLRAKGILGWRCGCSHSALEVVFAVALTSAYPDWGARRTTDWNVDGAHLAERCALFVIIALGESLLITGATFAAQAWDADTLAAFLAAFLGSIAMWWLVLRHRRRAGGAPDRARGGSRAAGAQRLYVSARADRRRHHRLRRRRRAGARASAACERCRNRRDPLRTAAVPRWNRMLQMGDATIGAARRCRTWREWRCCSSFSSRRSRIGSAHSRSAR